MALSDLSEPAVLVYRQELFNAYGDLGHLPPPLVDHLHAPWTVGTSGMSGEDPHPGAGPLLDTAGYISDPMAAYGNGVRLSVTRPQGSASAIPSAVLCGLSVPTGLKRFQISADFQLMASDTSDGLTPTGPDVQWAASVFIRDGDLLATDAQTVVVGATHQVRGDPTVVTLGAGSYTLSQTSPAPLKVGVDSALAHNRYANFRLDAYIDCWSGEGQSQLTTSAGYHWENTWNHPFRIGATPPKFMSCIGFGLAIARGAGTPTVVAKEFRVLNWPDQHPLVSGGTPPIGPAKDAPVG